MSSVKQTVVPKLVSFLNSPGGRGVLGVAATAAACLRTRSLVRIAYRNNYWEHWQQGRCLLEATPKISLLPEVRDRLTRDHWLTACKIATGSVVIDVGAGVGDDVMTFSRQVGPTGKVIAIEAHPVTFECLQNMCRRNNLQNVIPVFAAIHDSEQSVTISDVSEHLSNAIGTTASGFEVPGTTLDRIIEQYALDRVDFLKMNIEGAETLALAGLKAGLSKVRHFAISCHDFLADRGGNSDNRTYQKVYDFLVKNGFQPESRQNDPRDFIRYQLYANPVGSRAA